MMNVESLFLKAGLPSNLVKVEIGETELINESEITRRQDGGEEAYRIIGDKIAVVDNCTNLYKFPYDNIWVSLSLNANSETNDYGLTNLDNHTYVRREFEDDSFEIASAIHFQTAEEIRENANKIKNPAEFRRKRMQEIKEKKLEENNMAGKFKKDELRNVTGADMEILDETIEDNAPKAAEGGVTASNAFGGEMPSSDKDAEKERKAREKMEKAINASKEAELIKRRREERDDNLTANKERVIVSSRVKTEAIKHIKIEGVLTKVEAQTKLALRKRDKKDANGKFSLNVNHLDAVSDDPIKRQMFEESKRIAETDPSKIKPKYRVKEKYIDSTQAKPSGIERYFISYPAKLDLQAPAEEMERTFAELSEKAPNQIERVVRPLTVDQFNLLYVNLGLVSSGEGLFENEEVYKGQRGAILVNAIEDQKEEHGRMTSFVRFTRKRVGRAKGIISGAYFPLRVFKQLDLNQPLSENQSKLLDETYFSNIFNTDESFAAGVSDNFEVLDATSKEVKSKYFTQNVNGRIGIEVKPFDSEDKDFRVAVSRIPFKGLKMTMDPSTKQLVPSTAKNNKEYKKIFVYDVEAESAKLENGEVMNNPLVDADFEAIRRHLGDLLSVEALKSYTVKVKAKRAGAFKPDDRLIATEAVSTLIKNASGAAYEIDANGNPIKITGIGEFSSVDDVPTIRL